MRVKQVCVCWCVRGAVGRRTRRRRKAEDRRGKREKEGRGGSDATGSGAVVKFELSGGRREANVGGVCVAAGKGGGDGGQ